MCNTFAPIKWAVWGYSMRSSFEIDSDGKLYVHRVTKSVQAPHPVRLTRQAQIIRVQIFAGKQ